MDRPSHPRAPWPPASVAASSIFWIAWNSPQLDSLDLWRFPIHDAASPPAIAPTARVTPSGRSPSCWTVKSMSRGFPRIGLIRSACGSNRRDSLKKQSPRSLRLTPNSWPCSEISRGLSLNCGKRGSKVRGAKIWLSQELRDDLERFARSRTLPYRHGWCSAHRLS
jgi:hypothetical protein